jgi:excisionase family DNA binding protein
MITHKPTKAESPLLTEVEAADALRLSTRTLQAWRIKKVGPPFLRAGRAVRYRESDLTDWIEASIISTSGAARSRRPEHGGKATSMIDDSKN